MLQTKTTNTIHVDIVVKKHVLQRLAPSSFSQTSLQVLLSQRLSPSSFSSTSVEQSCPTKKMTLRGGHLVLKACTHGWRSLAANKQNVIYVRTYSAVDIRRLRCALWVHQWQVAATLLNAATSKHWFHGGGTICVYPEPVQARAHTHPINT